LLLNGREYGWRNAVLPSVKSKSLSRRDRSRADLGYETVHHVTFLSSDGHDL
jgi:hypothetical protein